jgi:hypothetical protein
MHSPYINTDQGLSVLVHQVNDLKEQVSNNCPEITGIKFPDKRQELIDLINASKDEDNPILQIFHLKL